MFDVFFSSLAVASSSHIVLSTAAVHSGSYTLRNELVFSSKPTVQAPNRFARDTVFCYDWLKTKKQRLFIAYRIRCKKVV